MVAEFTLPRGQCNESEETVCRAEVTTGSQSGDPDPVALGFAGHLNSNGLGDNAMKQKKRFAAPRLKPEASLAILTRVDAISGGDLGDGEDDRINY